MLSTLGAALCRVIDYTTCLEGAGWVTRSQLATTKLWSDCFLLRGVGRGNHRLIDGTKKRTERHDDRLRGRELWSLRWRSPSLIGLPLLVCNVPQVRYDANSNFKEHGHPDGEEILVLEGTWQGIHVAVGLWTPGRFYRCPIKIALDPIRTSFALLVESPPNPAAALDEQALQGLPFRWNFFAFHTLLPPCRKKALRRLEKLSTSCPRLRLRNARDARDDVSLRCM